MTPGEWERRNGPRLRFVYRRSGPSMLVPEGRLNARGRAVRSRSKTGRGVATVPIFLLVPQVKLPKRLDLVRDAVRAHDALPGLVVAEWLEVLIGSCNTGHRITEELGRKLNSRVYYDPARMRRSNTNPILPSSSFGPAPRLPLKV
jgi:hypothetical protein